MKPYIVSIEEFMVSGLTIRTKNSDEFNPKSAKIPNLWNQFITENVIEKIKRNRPKAEIKVVGVYSNYESDTSGFYDLTTAICVETPESNFNNIKIQKGTYLVFSAKGLMPDTLIQTWQSIWAYFEANPTIKRCYLTDFETYLTTEKVDVYIGISAKSSPINSKIK